MSLLLFRGKRRGSITLQSRRINTSRVWTMTMDELKCAKSFPEDSRLPFIGLDLTHQ